MGKADIAVKNWLSDNDRFADLFNGTIFGGRQIVRPEELENMDDAQFKQWLHELGLIILGDDVNENSN